MKKIASTYILVTLLLLGSSWIYCNGEQSKVNVKLSVDDFGIVQDEKELQFSDSHPKVIKLGQPMADVLKLLGNPLSKELIRHKSDHKWDYMYYYYQGLSFGFYPNFLPQELDTIIINNMGFKTFRGIEVGDKKGKVIDLYGEKKPWGKDYVYQLSVKQKMPPELVYSIAFYIENSIVQKIVINFAGD